MSLETLASFGPLTVLRNPSDGWLHLKNDNNYTICYRRANGGITGISIPDDVVADALPHITAAVNFMKEWAPCPFKIAKPDPTSPRAVHNHALFKKELKDLPPAALFASEEEDTLFLFLLKGDTYVPFHICATWSQKVTVFLWPSLEQKCLHPCRFKRVDEATALKIRPGLANLRITSLPPSDAKEHHVETSMLFCEHYGWSASTAGKWHDALARVPNSKTVIKDPASDEAWAQYWVRVAEKKKEAEEAKAKEEAKAREEEARNRPAYLINKNLLLSGTEVFVESYYSPDVRVYAERINGEWTHIHSDGTRLNVGTNRWLDKYHKEGGGGGWVASQTPPKPLGYRAFNTTTNKWATADDRITLLLQKPATNPFGWDYRPWFGPSLVK